MRQPPIPTDYAAGQLWRCNGREPGEQPTLLINLVETHPLGGRIFHVTLDGLRVRHPGLPGGVMTRLAHAPVIEQTFERSGMVYIGPQAPAADYRKGYDEWRQAFDAGHAASFGVSVPTILEILERRLNGIPLDQP